MKEQLSAAQIELLQSAIQSKQLSLYDIISALDYKVRGTEKYMNDVEYWDPEMLELYQGILAAEKAKLALVEKIHSLGLQTVEFGRRDVKPMYKDPGLSNWKPTGC